MASGTLPQLMETLKLSLESAAASLPSEAALAPPKDGISLFDLKNELFLAYLQNLVFLILFKIKQLKDGTLGAEDDEHKKMWDETVKSLVGIRLYCEKGIKPLENRLHYELDRVVKAAEDATKSTSTQTNGVSKKKNKKKSKRNQDDLEDGHSAASEDGEEEGDGDDDDDDDDESGSGSDADSDGVEEEVPRAPALRANLATLRTAASKAVDNRGTSTGIYRPPRVAATAMPTTTPAERKAKARGPVRSEALNEYLADELSGAPSAMPSVGSNIERKGRSVTTSAQRREADERRTYEETNFVRLPAVSKKEKRRREGAAGGMQNGFGGEDWRDLGAGAERVMRDLDQRRRGQSALDRSRKRGPEEFGSSGASGPSAFSKKRRAVQKRARK